MSEPEWGEKILIWLKFKPIYWDAAELEELAGKKRLELVFQESFPLEMDDWYGVVVNRVFMLFKKIV